MKNYLIYSIIIFTTILIGCTANKGIITTNNLTDKSVLIIGLVEYDYTGLKNKGIGGINLYVDSKGYFSDFKLHESYPSSDRLKQYEFISTYGDMGSYNLCFKNKLSNSTESGNLLTLMDMEQSPETLNKMILYQYSINQRLVLNLGKIIVKYQGGTMDNGSIKYTYSFETAENDTLALSAFKTAYPDIYEEYKNEIYDFANEFNQCVDYVITNVSKDKGLAIKNYIEANPDKTKEVFKELRPETQKNYVKWINSFTSDELANFLIDQK
jgi:hypothetical protein